MAKVKLAEVRKHLDDTYVTRAGGTGDDDAFYVRVHSPVVWVEVDCQAPGPLAGARRHAAARPLRHPHPERQRLREGTPASALPDVAAPPVTRTA
ncbi:DUF3500 domain-containing protein [Streptomyces sp. NPDC000345]|uniref:DUF3500 domain-containing protein n=1 Tax=Streptomyces sp. NPDC000345 TaxID=3364537 RepID=UPI0036830951